MLNYANESLNHALLFMVKAAMMPASKSKNEISKTENIDEFELNFLQAYNNTNTLDFPNSHNEWQKLMNLAAAQGVYAIALDGIETIDSYHNFIKEKIPKDLLIQWELGKLRIEMRYKSQVDCISKFEKLLNNEGINLLVLKGIGLSLVYPVKEHRECGDIDVYLYGKFEIGNNLAKSIGLEVIRVGDKHTQFVFKGFTIENHNTFLNSSLCRTDMQLEKELSLLVLESVDSSNGQTANYPSANFNAIFLTRHAIKHFLSGGIVLRHIIDLALFFEKNHSQVNFKHITKILYMNNQYRLLISFLYIAKQYFRLCIGFDKFTAEYANYKNYRSYPDFEFKKIESLSARVYEDIFNVRQRLPKKFETELGEPLSIKRIKWGAKRFFKSKWRYDTTGSTAFWSQLSSFSAYAIKIIVYIFINKICRYRRLSLKKFMINNWFIA